MRKTFWFKGGAILPFLFLAGCVSPSEDSPKEAVFLRAEAYFGYRTFLDSQWVLIQINHDSVFTGTDAPNGDAETIKRSVRNFLVRADSQAPIRPLRSDFDPLNLERFPARATFEHGGHGKILDTRFGWVFDVFADSVYAPDFQAPGPVALCDLPAGADSFTDVMEFRSGPDTGGYLLTCRYQTYASPKWVNAFFRIGSDGKAARLRADSAGRPWVGVASIAGELWGAFLGPDSLKLRLAPLDSNASARAFEIGMRVKFTRDSDLSFFHIWGGTWIGYDDDVVKFSGPVAAADWRVAWIDDYYDVRDVNLDDKRKQIGIWVGGPPWSKLIYDFTEYMQ
jgi:hypothetical protein